MWKIKTVMKKIVRSFAIAASAALIGAASLPAAAEQAVQTSAVETTAEETWMDAMYADLSELPAYSDSPYYVLNDNVPYFSEADFTTESFESYGDLDSLGRCTTAYACLGLDTMPTEERGRIGMIKPSGWQTPQSKFDFIDGKYVYNRCHELAYSLSGENANPQNLMTGTRYFNVDGMEPYELSILGYVQKTGNHVLYRATPIFVGNELEARGILLEAESIEDGGRGIQFNAFIYNVQPGVVIDYATGAVAAGDSQADRALAIQNYASTVLYDEYGNVSQMHSHGGKSKSAAAGSRAGAADASKGKGVSASAGTATAAANAAGGTGQASAESGAAVGSAEDGKEITYVVNSNTGKFHRPGCSSVSQMKQKNRLDTTESRDQLIAEGYSPCKRCNP